MGLYEVPLSMLGFGMGTMLVNFLMLVCQDFGSCYFNLLYSLLDLTCCECDV